MKTKNFVGPALRRFPVHCLVFAAAIFCASCASQQRVGDVTPVATIPQNSDGSDLGTHGFLLVNTPTETRWDENSVRHFPHTGYTIIDLSTHQVAKYVPNHYGVAGDDATLELLPAGNYMIEAQTVYHQPIRFPVIIRPDTQTTVNLDSNSPVPKTLNGEFYTLRYHGRTVGWLTEAKAM